MRRLLFLALFALVLPAADPGQTHLVYTVRVAPGGEGGYHFKLEVVNPKADRLTFVVPFWAPGAYRQITVGVRSGQVSWKGLTDIAAQDEDGKVRAVTAAGDRKWQVESKGARRIVFEWRNASPSDRPNNRSYLIENSGVIDGPRNWMYLEGAKDLPVHVRFELPEGWKVGTGLDPTFDPMVFTAKDYDRLVDCPTLIGLFHEWRFSYRGVPHRVLAATAGREPRFDVDAFMDMVKAVVKVYVDLFDDVPYEHYTFIYTGGGGGGLEHLTSTTISAGNATRLRPRFLQSVTAHEFFHTWNVKRLRPAKLGPFDYTGPVVVKDLWICEGLTSYYTPIGLWRAQLVDDAGFRRSMASAINSYLQDERSWYEPSEVSSAQVWEGGPLRYYNTGKVLGFAIDLMIRAGSENESSLDDVMREMYKRYGGYYRHHEGKRGFESEDWERVIAEVTGVNATPFWDAHVRGSEPVDWNHWLGLAGWHLEVVERTPGGFRTAVVTTGPDGVGAQLRAPEGGALYRAGFRTGDRLLELDGREMTGPRGARRRLGRMDAGRPFTARVARGGEELEVSGKVPGLHEAAMLSYRAGSEAPVLEIVPTDLSFYAAGLRAGDRIVAIGEDRIASVSDAEARLSALPLGKAAAVVVDRDGQSHTFEVEPRVFVRPRARSIQSIENPTPRQLAIRKGLADGTALGWNLPR